ncbi:MAG: hypothetical protein AB1472_00415 [Candidatus Omnitrophota bacterium]
MPTKPKFEPEITRIKLNPEQAVITCNCITTGYGTLTGRKSYSYCGTSKGDLSFSCSKTPNTPSS